MCGIYGVLHPSEAFTHELKRMGESLAHRGPDVHRVVDVRGGVLGHTRLSIINLSEAGAQPMWDVTGAVCISYNGEIYNTTTLREECKRAGLAFRSTSDTEVILNQYLLHGEAAFDKLNGIFAFCLFDARSGEFYLVRDAMGVKPLYYANTPRGLFFASELKALMRGDIVDLELDPIALRAYLQYDYVPSPLCILKGVNKLRGGDLLHVRSKSDARLKSFTTLHASLPTLHRSLDDDVREFHRVFEDAVARQWVADVPVGVFLSGGMDSSLVARAAAERAGRTIDTFSMSFEDKSFDESEHASVVARAIGSHHHVQTVSPRDMLDVIPNLPNLACEPLADGSIVPTALLCRFAQQHVTVALSGDGADELFAGYPTYLAAKLSPLLRALPDDVPSRLASVARRWLPVNLDNMAWDYRLKKFLDGAQSDPLVQNARWLGTFKPTELPKLLRACPPPPYAELDVLMRERSHLAPPDDTLQRLLRMDERFYMQDEVLVKVDRASMAASLEVRVPFLDAEVVRFARALPSDRKLHHGTGKYLLRKYGANRLPPSTISRRKKGFGAPYGKWFKTELRDLLMDTLSPSRMHAQGVFQPSAVESLLSAHFSGGVDLRKQLFNLLAFSLWHDRYMRNRSARVA